MSLSTSKLRTSFSSLVCENVEKINSSYFSSVGKHLLVAYWGQNSAGGKFPNNPEKDLKDVCAERKYDIIVIGFVVTFFGKKNKGTCVSIKNNIPICVTIYSQIASNKRQKEFYTKIGCVKVVRVRPLFLKVVYTKRRANKSRELHNLLREGQGRTP